MGHRQIIIAGMPRAAIRALPITNRMQNRWDSDADRCTTPLALLVHGSRLRGANAPKPSIETFMHAARPPRFVNHTHAAPVLAITNIADGSALSLATFSDIAIIVPYHHSGLELAHACAAAWRRDYRPGPRGMVLMHHSAVAWG